jgi:hypothetical protein
MVIFCNRLQEFSVPLPPVRARLTPIDLLQGTEGSAMGSDRGRSELGEPANIVFPADGLPISNPY